MMRERVKTVAPKHMVYLTLDVCVETLNSGIISQISEKKFEDSANMIMTMLFSGPLKL